MKCFNLTTRLTDSSANCSMGTMAAGDSVPTVSGGKGSQAGLALPVPMLVQGAAFVRSIARSHSSANRFGRRRPLNPLRCRCPWVSATAEPFRNQNRSLGGYDMANSARFGLTLSNRGVLLGLTTPTELIEMAEAADSSGAFAHVWVGDQIMAKPRMESIVLMAGIAARTKSVKIGPACMASFPSRHPIVLAYQWASLDQLSDGRMIMAACMGVPESQNLARIELNNMGITNRERGPRLEEGITILRRLWAEESVTFEGRFYEMEEAFVEPKPVQEPPPIWVIGTPNLRGGDARVTERNLRRVARLGDGWMTTAWPPADFAELVVE